MTGKESLFQSRRPRLLDLFCGAGGCAAGYQRAGFYVVGVDNAPQPNYCGDDFVQGDALEVIRRLLSEQMQPQWYDLNDFDAIHASPPCQAFSLASLYHGHAGRDEHPDLVAPVRGLLWKTGLPFVIENVAGAPIRKDVMLCGEMFGLRLHRHRYFETHGFFVMQPKHAKHQLKGAEHNCHIEDGHARLVAGHFANLADASDAMGIDWMTKDELAEAIPPAYTKHIGDQLIQHVLVEVTA